MHSHYKQKGASALVWIVGLLIIAGLFASLYSWAMLKWSYSEGERAGWVQKLSKKGWLCKTWEGEMAMVSLPGSVPEKFLFTILDDTVANKINDVIGKRVALHYEEHIGLPSSCFGETRHFIKSVKQIEETPAPLPVTASPAASATPAIPTAPAESTANTPKQ